MLTSLEDVRPGWSVRVIAGLRRAPSWEEWKRGNVPLGAQPIEVTALIRRVHPRTKIISRAPSPTWMIRHSD
jgi:hypothetical protein